MSITFDASAGNIEQLLAQQARGEVDPGPCGEGLDWSRGLQGLSRLQRTSADNPGSLLTKVIEGEIIPRLFLAHRAHANANAQAKRGVADIISGDDFTRLVLASESEEILDVIDDLMDRGVTLDRIFLDLLAPVARKLGALWEEDHCTFVDVTLALSRLHQVLHRIGRRNCVFQESAQSRSAFFAPVPGEKHTFGVSMLEEFFRHAGWQTDSDHVASAAKILHVAATQRLDIIGFSVGCQELLDPLSDIIDKTRDASCNRDVVIMVGGGLFVGRSDLTARFGNATIVADGIHAVQVAEEIVSRLRKPAEARKIV